MFKGVLEVDLEGEIELETKVDFKQDLEGDFLSSSGHVQVRSRSGPGQVQVTAQIYFFRA